ncbi:prolyl oligopeptidase family serine peptidase [Alicyclobacillus tolerans]|uniref:alpha/beta hydrolase family protein n=1 Tax=Alicyclobacillus tolerans TaxID=90970 RepID=UPI001EFF7A37|nr:prolyl oligopeptidase family serine peptidase [Alicyclobacillus tolerans]MCF8566712.1 prolyl oligopeptidase family serine peptidase [Alicyclobacillus tolerans]
MPIYHMTYLSDNFKVKGYLGLPPSYRIDGDDLSKWLRKHYRSKALFPNETVQPADNSANLLDLFNPDPKQVPLPGFIYCRGGIKKVGAVKLEWVEEFASFGYAVFAPSYRGNEGGQGKDTFGGQDREDVFAAFRFMQELPFVDRNRVSIMGFSRGAVNALLAAANLEGVYRAVTWGGVADLALTYDQRPDLRKMLIRVTGGTPEEVPEAYQERSPLAFAQKIHCPVLVMHGTNDVQVDFSQGEALYARLKELGKTVAFHRLEGLGHHMPEPEHGQAVSAMFDWLKSDVAASVREPTSRS